MSSLHSINWVNQHRPGEVPVALERGTMATKTLGAGFASYNRPEFAISCNQYQWNKYVFEIVIYIDILSKYCLTSTITKGMTGSWTKGAKSCIECLLKPCPRRLSKKVSIREKITYFEETNKYLRFNQNSLCKKKKLACLSSFYLVILVYSS